MRSRAGHHPGDGTLRWPTGSQRAERLGRGLGVSRAWTGRWRTIDGPGDRAAKEWHASAAKATGGCAGGERILVKVTAFLSPAAILAPALTKAHPREGVLSSFRPRSDFARRSNDSNEKSAAIAPSACPACRSLSISTTTKNPDDNSYWRCATCGEVWNAARRGDPRRGSNPWR